ncbi:hypothetical protein AYI70_g4390 [Smittium culicis]|uniref:Uncharacterized protein n=1 Tax=Smittium culicis TaxID=133412 RepID=A0A1R1XZ73_9FUNG|nr:hypothetical protein AYI70_g4390 [Smittium culicis]
MLYISSPGLFVCSRRFIASLFRILRNCWSTDPFPATMPIAPATPDSLLASPFIASLIAEFISSSPISSPSLFANSKNNTDPSTPLLFPTKQPPSCISLLLNPKLLLSISPFRSLTKLLSSTLLSTIPLSGSLTFENTFMLFPGTSTSAPNSLAFRSSTGFTQFCIICTSSAFEFSRYCCPIK